MAKKDMKRKHLAASMEVSAPRVSQMLGRSNNYKLQTLVKIARGVGAVLEIRLADESSEVVRVVDVETARDLDEKVGRPARDETPSPGVVLARVLRFSATQDEYPPLETPAAAAHGFQEEGELVDLSAYRAVTSG